MRCLTRAFWGAHKWAEMLRHPCILGDPQTKGNKISQNIKKLCLENFHFGAVQDEKLHKNVVHHSMHKVELCQNIVRPFLGGFRFKLCLRPGFQSAIDSSMWGRSAAQHVVGTCSRKIVDHYPETGSLSKKGGSKVAMKHKNATYHSP